MKEIRYPKAAHDADTTTNKKTYRRHAHPAQIENDPSDRHMVEEYLAEALREGASALGRELLSRLGWNHDPLTLSLGVAAFPHHGSNGSAVLRAADEALYRAKQTGRNKVVVAGRAREAAKR